MSIVERYKHLRNAKSKLHGMKLSSAEQHLINTYNLHGATHVLSNPKLTQLCLYHLLVTKNLSYHKDLLRHWLLTPELIESAFFDSSKVELFASKHTTTDMFYYVIVNNLYRDNNKYKTTTWRTIMRNPNCTWNIVQDFIQCQSLTKSQYLDNPNCPPQILRENYASYEKLVLTNPNCPIDLLTETFDATTNNEVYTRQNGNTRQLNFNQAMKNPNYPPSLFNQIELNSKDRIVIALQHPRFSTKKLSNLFSLAKSQDDLSDTILNFGLVHPNIDLNIMFEYLSSPNQDLVVDGMRRSSTHEQIVRNPKANHKLLTFAVFGENKYIAMLAILNQNSTAPLKRWYQKLNGY